MSIKSIILDAVFPDGLSCISCGREAVLFENGLCPDCSIGLEVFNSAPMLERLDSYTAAYVYNDVSGRIVKRLKYDNARYLAKPLADAIELPSDWKIDAVVPVPLHRKRLAKRGYNQSELIANHLAKRYGLRLAPELLVRRVNTKQQTKMTVAGRKRNLKGAFLADESCRGLNILLVDDVITTGTTMSECALALKEFGCGRIYGAAACCAVRE